LGQAQPKAGHRCLQTSPPAQQATIEENQQERFDRR